MGTSPTSRWRRHPAGMSSLLLAAPAALFLLLFLLLPLAVLAGHAFASRDEVGNVVWDLTTQNLHAAGCR